MYQKIKQSIFLYTAMVVVIFSACSKKWDDHNAITDSAVANNLFQVISKTPNLTKFTNLLVKSGFDKVLANSKTFTVWAPNDQALQSLDPSIINDTAQLKLFVANHICNQSYPVSFTAADKRVLMMNGKYLLMSGNHFDSASYVNINQYAGNGLFHVIDKYIPRYNNCWELIKTTTTAASMQTYLLSLNKNQFDPTFAKQTGVDPNSGLPVYDSSTGMVLHNIFLDSVVNVNDETNQYTVILLNDAAYSNELNKLTPWFKTSTTDSTNNLSAFWLVKDLAFKGSYSASQLPDTLISQYGVKVPINKSSIIASYKTSNGWVHVMSQVNFKLTDKFPSIIIQGENPSFFTYGLDRTANTFYRVRYNPVTGKNFNDILMTNYGVANYYIGYYLRNLNSMRYNAYWVAVNDIQSTPLWQQRLANGYTYKDATSGNTVTTFTTTLPAVSIAYQNYNEVALGQFNFSNYGNRTFYVLGPTVSSTSGNVDAITLDYIRLEPAF